MAVSMKCRNFEFTAKLYHFNGRKITRVTKKNLNLQRWLVCLRFIIGVKLSSSAPLFGRVLPMLQGETAAVRPGHTTLQDPDDRYETGER